MLAIVEKICDNRIPDIKPPIKRKLDDFAKVIQRLKKLALEVRNWITSNLVLEDEFLLGRITS